MSIHRDKARGCYIFEFDRVIEGQRVRARKLLPKAWTRAQVDTYDRQESARLYAIATSVERPQYTIEDAVAKYLQERVPNLKSANNIENELAQMFWAYKDRPLSELPEACKEYAIKARKEIKDKNGSVVDAVPLAPSTIRNRIRYLTSACRYSWKHHNMCEHDPAARVVVPEVNNERQHYINRREMLLIAKSCDCRATRAAIRIGFYSGMRIGEIVKAVIDADVFILSDTKNGNPRHVPIHPKIKRAIKVKLRDQYWMSKQFKKAAILCGLDELRFHDLRHSAASAMINADVDLYTVGAVLGHKSAASTKRYSHLATSSLRKALSKIGSKKVA